LDELLHAGLGLGLVVKRRRAGDPEVIELDPRLDANALYGIMSNVSARLMQTPVTDGLFGGAMELFDSEFVVPLVTYLVSDQCSCRAGSTRSAAGASPARWSA
jgi:hypothetical protein